MYPHGLKFRINVLPWNIGCSKSLGYPILGTRFQNPGYVYMPIIPGSARKSLSQDVKISCLNQLSITEFLSVQI